MSKNSKILVVEDEPDFNQLLCHVLKENGYQVQSATNGEEGFKLYRTWGPDGVILDVHLPDMTGFEICRKIRTEGPEPETPVLICTVRSEVSGVAEGLGSGADDYILKPFQISDFLARLQTALSREKKEE